MSVAHLVLVPSRRRVHSYLFNLRDLSRVFQGMFAIDVDATLDSEFTLLALWKHECMRVFSDKLVNHQDKAWFKSCLDKVTEAKWGAEAASAVADEAHFVDYMREAPEDPETGEL